jgi:hypothetical protein
VGRLLSELALGAPGLVDPARFRRDRFAAFDYPDDAAVETAMRSAREAPVIEALDRDEAAAVA